MRTPRFLVGVVSLCLFLTACPSLTLNQRQTAAVIGGAVLDLAQTASNLAVNIIVAKATSGQDLSAKSNYLDSAAAGLRSLQNKTGGLVTAQDVGAIVSQFTDPSKTHWSDLANKLSKAYASDPTPSPDVKLEALAIGLNTAAASASAAANTPTTP